MSLPDPTSLAGYNATAVTGYTGATALSMARQVEGRYISTNVGTNDEPILMSVTSDFRPQANSTFTIRLTRNKNVPPINGLPQSDDVMIASLQIKVPHRSFTSTDAQGLGMALMSLVADSTLWNRVLRGER